MREAVIQLLGERKVRVEQIASVVHMIQHGYYDELRMDECIESVEEVINKREVQHALLTGIALDMLAEEEQLPEPLQSIVANDDALYGVDEVMALSITNVYGSIGLTNFGYLDKVKPGVIASLHDYEREGAVNTFLDDLVAGIAAAAAARLAHNRER